MKHGEFSKLTTKEGVDACEWPMGGCHRPPKVEAVTGYDGKPTVLRFNKNIGKKGGLVPCCDTCALIPVQAEDDEEIGCGSCTLGIGVGGEVQRCDDCSTAAHAAGALSDDVDAGIIASRCVRACETIREILWPAGDPDHEREASTLEDIAEQLQFLMPRES